METIIKNAIFEANPIEAEEQGAFVETALTDEEAYQSLLDTIDSDTDETEN